MGLNELLLLLSSLYLDCDYWFYLADRAYDYYCDNVIIVCWVVWFVDKGTG